MDNLHGHKRAGWGKVPRREGVRGVGYGGEGVRHASLILLGKIQFFEFRHKKRHKISGG